MLSFCCETKSQTNLVPNGSFEEYDICPITFDQLNGYCQKWFDGNGCSSDYYQACSSNVGTPSNGLGFQAPYDGFAYAGFYAFWKPVVGFREAIGIELLKKLENGKKYCFSMFISLADSMCYSVNEIDIAFSSNIYANTVCNYTPINLPSTLKFNMNGFYSDKQNWKKVEGNFIANGTEKYLYITNLNFQNDTLNLCENINDSYLGAYYYVDYVKLEECDNLTLMNIPNVFSPNEDGVNDKWYFYTTDEIYNLKIFNRWGTLILDNQQNNWNGKTQNNDDCNDGVYYFIYNSLTKKEKGFIQLVR